MATLLLKNINKIYTNNVQAVFDFSLEIKDQEFIVLVGPSGCGKSTTLRMIAGLEDISSGELYIGGNFVNSVVPKDRDIAMVFQNYALYPHMTVYGNMAFALKLRKIPCPIYSNEEDAAPYYAEIREIRKEIKAIDTWFKKHQDDYSLLEQRQELYHKIYDLLDQAKEVLKPIYGIDERQINHNLMMIDILEKEIVKIERTLAKGNLHEVREKILLESLQQKANQIKYFQEKVEFYQNTEVPLYKMRKLTREEIDVEVNKAAESIDLIKYLFRKPAALSGGQRQRVALGRAIVRKPKVFLMDEPLSNLDAKLRVQTRSEIIKIHKQVGATTIYVTHDQTEAMTMADRIIIMRDGYIQQVGTPEEVYSEPENMFVGGFIGSPSMNFINGVFDGNKFIIEGEHNIAFELSEKHIKTLKGHEGTPICLGIRPEDIYLADDKSNENPSQDVKVLCDFAELLGHEKIVYGDVDKQRITIKIPSKYQITEGEQVVFNFDDTKILFFDLETTKRIK